ncbi:MAG TPA: TerB family tellurite resistance protein [Acidobacteriota bacterium]|nr:TerB family tellurite resistance protein [Acidobacteriota bacterium]
MSILRFLGLSSDQETEGQQNQDVESIRKISQQLAEMEPQRARYVAAFAYLLGRVAHADRDISQDEDQEMERIVMEKGHLPKEQAVMIVEIAKRQNQLFGHVENFLVTREFNHLASREMKMDLLNCLFAVSSSDESVSTVEDREIRQITSELLLEHSDFIETRSKYRGFLDVLKDSKK